MSYEPPGGFSPRRLHRAARRASPYLGVGALVLITLGLVVGLAWAPADGSQGDAARIAVLHGPAVAMAFGVYLAVGALSVVTLRTHARASALLAHALAPTGVLFTGLALWTEGLWRRAVEGAWWAWDAHGMSLLMLLFLYGGVLALKAMIDDARRADRAAALLALLGAGNLPVLYASLAWWDRLRHAARGTSASPGIVLAAATVLVALGFACYAAHAAVRRLRCLVAEGDAAAREHRRLMENVR